MQSGDLVKIFKTVSQGDIEWQGTVQLDWQRNRAARQGSFSQQQVWGYWIHGLQDAGKELRRRSPDWDVLVLAAGTIEPIVYETFPLSEAAAAHALMESSTHVGKIVLTV